MKAPYDPKMSQSETQFKRRVLADLKKLDRIWVLKTQERARKGVPDIIIGYRGQLIAIELKRDGEKLEPIQRVVLCRIQEAECLAFSTRPSEWASHYKMIQEIGT